MNTDLAVPVLMRRAPLRIYVPIAGLAVALALAGFWPTYFGRLVTGTLQTTTLIHVHAAVYMGWLMLVIAQGYLAATGRTVLHVKVGRFGMAYGVVVILVGLLAAFSRFGRQVQAGEIFQAQARLFGPVTDMVIFAGLLAAAWVYRRRPDIHKRLIIVATTMLLIAAVGRMPFWHGTRIMSVREIVPFLFVWLSPIYIAMAHDYYRRRIVHPVYVMGLIGLTFVRMRALLIDSDAWLGFAGWLAKFYLSLAFVAVLGVSSVSVAAEPNLLPDKPNIWGVWLGTRDYPEVDPRYRNTPWPRIEFTAWGAAESKRLMTHVTPDACMPGGPAAYVPGGSYFPLEIARAVTGVVMLYEAAPLPRRIYTDGRGHPEDLDPTWLGHSVGHWEGDTLVIDTVGTNGRGRPLNNYVAGGVGSKTDKAPRLPVSEQLHLVERIRLVADGQYLENEITIHDPKSYTHPFTVRRYWMRRPDLDVLEYFCAEGDEP